MVRLFDDNSNIDVAVAGRTKKRASRMQQAVAIDADGQRSVNWRLDASMATLLSRTKKKRTTK